MISRTNAVVRVGGNVPGNPPIRDETRPFEFRFLVWKYSDEPFSFIDINDAVRLRYLITDYYSKVSKIGRVFVGDIVMISDFTPQQGAMRRQSFAQYWGNSIISQFADLGVFFQGRLAARIDQSRPTVVNIDFDLQIRWRDIANPQRPIGQKPGLNTHWSAAFPSYMDSEGTGYILLDRDNNLDGPIQNVNLTVRDDENFVKNQVEFTNIPLFSRSLFVRPKKKEKAHKHCCHKQNKKTTTDSLEYMMSYIYENARSVLKEFISNQEGEANIRSIVEEYNQYRVKGTNLVFSYIKNDEVIMINMCARYRLESDKDCIVAFNMCSVENKELILKVSNSTVDEDMRDVIYPFIIPFGYQILS